MLSWFNHEKHFITSGPGPEFTVRCSMELLRVIVVLLGALV